MKSSGRSALLMVVYSVFLSGCALKREPLQHREDFFRPMTVLPQRNHISYSSTEIDQLKSQRDSVARAAVNVRDSLASHQKRTGTELISKNSYVDTVEELKSREFLIAAKEKNLEQNLAELQSENKKLSEQLREVETKHQMNSGKTEVSDITLSGASSAFKNHQYAQGLSLFNQRQYSGAQKIFSILLENGVEGAIADNCEYWLGECCFAQREYSNAIGHFRKVLSLDSSNKKIDAYFMLGKTYERMGDGEKARITYTELNARYPSNGHAKVVKSRLEALRNIVGD